MSHAHSHPRQHLPAEHVAGETAHRDAVCTGAGAQQLRHVLVYLDLMVPRLELGVHLHRVEPLYVVRSIMVIRNSAASS